ncbi:fibrillin-1-like isoform X2 [Topomyia yanbarensis]|uniref:fibrillin-1-like isoform X2 n=1 Tax=Topomyia yanbarensis TaxID=2498891 RepID=UPI00273B967F|nr:fibrillin-1-like isoform X2 [Topomyia yanbarensis]
MTANWWRNNLRLWPLRVSTGALWSPVSVTRLLLMVLLLTSTVRSVAGQTIYEDCEQPPDIAHGSARLTVDPSEEFVTAHYSCTAGYRMEGKVDIRCDIDSDEWQVEELPKCVPESPDDGSGGSSQQQQQPKKRKGSRGQNIQEETAVSSDMASQLDLSCMAQGLIHAPEIDNGYVVKYNRRKKDDHIFLVAFYECDDYYELQPPETDRLFCSDQQWIGTKPNCVSTRPEGEEEEDDEGEEEEEDYDEEDEGEGEEQPEPEEDKTNQLLPESMPTTTATTTTTMTTTEPSVSEQSATENVSHSERSGEVEAEVENRVVTGVDEDTNHETADTREGENEDTSEKINEEELDHQEETVQSSSTSTTTEQPREDAAIRMPDCGAGRGGCEHECQMVHRGNEVHPEVQCSCYNGFILDSQDGRSCHDINECDNENGGCQQICTNKPGSFECSCQSGLQIDVLDGKSCIDIDECQDDAVAKQCSLGCENTHGSYRCLTESASTSTERTSRDNDDDGADDGDEDDGDGEDDGGENEDEVDEEVGNKIENEIEEIQTEVGSSSVTSTSTTTEMPEIDEEINGEEQLNNEISTVEHDDRVDNELPPLTPEVDRSHIEEGLELPSGSKIDDAGNDDEDDGDDAEDFDRRQNEVEIHHHHPHRHHHGEVGREEGASVGSEFSSTTVSYSSAIDQDENQDPVQESENDIDDYLEPQYASSSTTTTSPRPIVECREGLRVNADGVCEDIDECEEQDHGCEYCRNAYGGYECTCPAGFELADDDKSCQDVNECESNDEDDDGVNMEEAEMSSVGVCSHECVNTVGSFECRCPDSFHLNNDRRTCVRDFCADLYENPNKTRCSHECKDGTEGFTCSCPEFYILDEFDRKTCRNVYSCGEEFKKRCDPGVCRVIEGGDYRCECLAGYQQHDHSCHDIDECELGRHMCSHDCYNTAGSYDCGCPRGLMLSTDNQTCDDVDECQQQDNGDLCGDLQCLNTYGSYKCVCPEGKELDEYGICRQMDLCTTDNGGCSHLCTFFNRETFCDCPDSMELADDGKTCVVINECDLNNGGCSHFCDPHLENICHCPEGFTLGADGQKCHDVNECLDNDAGCQQKCINLEGSYQCDCFDGFVISRSDIRVCLDVDECSTNQGGCDHHCHNTEGSFHCSCQIGYQLTENGRNCSDVNECDTENGKCSHICNNLLGSYQCSCPEGQYLTDDKHSCDFIDECELNNGGCSHTCHFHRGVVTCSCPKGFELEGNNFKTCVDINECSTGNGGCSGNCVNLPGSYHCSCPTGFELSRNRHSCEDIDECIENNGNCSNICINLIGDFKCACEAGFELEDDQQTCRDVDECTMKIHDCSHICVNVPGTFECDCPAGYVLGRDQFSCEDINECESSPDRGGCGHHCINLPGSYRCGCEDGHRLELNNRTCSDIDECTDELKKCSHDCLNTKGGFECSCPAGLRLHVDGVSCLDIDECKINSFNGGCSHICENEQGSFKCGCPDGWVLGSDQATCEDVNECSTMNGGCSQQCVNHRGGYRCECNSGFALMADNKTCEVSNPCALRNGGCDHFCSLKNSVSVCSCREGYVLNKTDLASCVDHDECRLATDNNCQQKCVNTDGSYSCECYTGYEKNELGQCLDVNECLEENGGCGSNARCLNLAGSFRCVCPPGYKMGKDRRNCFEIKSNCQPLKAPNNGDISCSRSRHKTQLFYRTKCSIRCKKGFKLVGPAVKQCNGTGHWDEGETLCIPQSCPRLQRPEHGTILPVACMSGKIYAGERCVLHCKPGFKPVGKRTAVCDTEQKWTPTPNLRCVPVATPTPVPIKPYIQCPSDVHEVLPVGQYTMKIRLEQPKTNVDWYKYVDAHPAWGKQLETELPVGETAVMFRARSPNSNMNDVCRVLIRIRERVPPQVANCPESFNVQLERQETSRSVFWVEPHFETESEIKQVYKSHTPGHVLIAGVHYVNYVATDADGLSAKCSFGITVKASPEARRPMQRPYDTNKLENHESFLICPGRSPIRIDANDPMYIPQGCVVKNVRIKQKLARLRHQQQVLQRHLKELEEAPNPDHTAIQQQHKRYNNLLRYYSSWDNAVSRHQGHQQQQQQPNEDRLFLHSLAPTTHVRRWFKKRSRDNDKYALPDDPPSRNQQEPTDTGKP